MQFLLLIYADEHVILNTPEQTTRERIAEYAAFTESLRKSGVLVASNRLRPTGTARTVRGSRNAPKVVDGPFAETKEQLGGFYLIDVNDREAALAWAARCPGAAHGSVEVRPVWTA